MYRSCNFNVRGGLGFLLRTPLELVTIRTGRFYQGAPPKCPKMKKAGTNLGTKGSLSLLHVHQFP